MPTESIVSSVDISIDKEDCVTKTDETTAVTVDNAEFNVRHMLLLWSFMQTQIHFITISYISCFRMLPQMLVLVICKYPM